MNIRHTVAPAMLVSLALMGLGCNPFAGVQEKINQKIGEAIVEKGIETASGGKLDIDADGGSFRVTDSKTGETANFGSGELPANFPSDLPRYPGGQIVLSSVASAGKKATLSQTVEADAKTVAAWYDEQLKAKGYTTEGEGSVGFNFYEYVKGDAKIVLTIYSQPSDDGKVYSSITAVYETK